MGMRAPRGGLQTSTTTQGARHGLGTASRESASRAKSRLAASLSSEQRTGLAEAMRDDVAKTLGDCPALSGVLVLSPDAAVRRWGAAQGFAVLDDGGAGLNGARSTWAFATSQRGVRTGGHHSLRRASSE